MFFKMLYPVAQLLVRLYYRVVFFAGRRIQGEVPKSTGMLLCGNHKSNNDPPLMAAFSPVQIGFLAKKELFSNKFKRWFLNGIGCIPLDRSKGDISVIRTCITALKNGRALLVFPEGTRHCHRLEDVKNGAVMFAIKAQVPIIPVGIHGRYKLFGGTRITYGTPIYYTEYYGKHLSADDYTALTHELMKRIYALADEPCPYQIP